MLINPLKIIKTARFMNIQTGEEHGMKSSISKSYEDIVLKKQEIVSNSIKVVVPLGQRNVPFRGAISGIFQANTRMEISIFRSLVG